MLQKPDILTCYRHETFLQCHTKNRSGPQVVSSRPRAPHRWAWCNSCRGFNLSDCLTDRCVSPVRRKDSARPLPSPAILAGSCAIGRGHGELNQKFGPPGRGNYLYSIQQPREELREIGRSNAPGQSIQGFVRQVSSFIVEW